MSIYIYFYLVERVLPTKCKNHTDCVCLPDLLGTRGAKMSEFSYS